MTLCRADLLERVGMSCMRSGPVQGNTDVTRSRMVRRDFVGGSCGLERNGRRGPFGEASRPADVDRLFQSKGCFPKTLA